MKKSILSLFLTLAMALSLLSGCGSAPAAKDAGSGSASADSKVASASEMAEQKDVVTDDLKPVDGSAVKDGTYAVTVDCSSSMFRITDCQLTVKDGKMTAVMTMSGTGYAYVYPGTGEQAAKADEKSYIPYEETADGVHTFTIPVQALDTGISCAAYSKRKQKWYDRTLVFRADSLPADALSDGVTATPESLGLKDGSYRMGVTLEGGSGRASVTSPAKLTIADGKATAEIIWSSSHYDYMVVDGTRYEPVSTEGNSVFEIPVSGFDFKLPVSADTTAMSTPHEIEYTLYFDSASIAPS